MYMYFPFSIGDKQNSLLPPAFSTFSHGYPHYPVH